MRLTRLQARRYRSLCDFELDIRPLNVLIGANAAGKSTVLDVLKFLKQGVQEGSFRNAIGQRGGMIHLAWKGRPADRIALVTKFREDDREYQWFVDLEVSPKKQRVVMQERIETSAAAGATQVVLEARDGHGWWWSGKHEKVALALGEDDCALSAASTNADFPGRELASFVRSWSFFDPHPLTLRRASDRESGDELFADGGNLAARLHWLRNEKDGRYSRIVESTRAILGVPRSLEFRESPETGRIYFMQEEEGLDYRVHQIGASSGTLRLLALATALLGSDTPSLIGIEEPENHLHPQAIDGFSQLLQRASETHQILVTTHWPGLLNGLDDPGSVCVVRRAADGTKAERPGNPEQIRQALLESGFGLGEYYASTGFGA